MSSGGRSSGFLTHAATYAIGNVARRLVGFLMLPIYTRYLTPADYGAVGLLTFALALLEPILGARLTSAIPKFYYEVSDARSRRAILWGSLISTTSVSAFTTALIVLLRHPASQVLFGSQRYELATGFFAVNMLSQPLEYTGLTYIRLQERSGLFLGVSMAKMALQIVLNLLLVVHWNMNVLGVVLSGIVSSLCFGIGLTIYIGFQSRPAFDWTMTRKMLQFSWPLWFAGLAGLYIGSSGGLFLRMLDSLSDVGLLELGLKFATVVSVLVWAPFFQHWEPASYRYYNEGVARQRFPPAFIGMSALLFSAGLGVSVLSQPVIRLMAAPAFHGAAPLVPILTVGLILNSLISFFYFGFFVTQRTKLYGLCHYLTAGVITVAYLGLIPRYGLEGAVIGQTLAFVVNFGLVYVWSRRYYDPGIRLAPMGIFMLIGASAYACANLLIQIRNPALDLAAKLAVLLGAISLMALVALKAIRSASPSAYEVLRQSLRELGGRLTRQEARG